MKLPHLDQLVLLERGEAGLLARAVAVLVDDVFKAQRPVPALELLSTLPLVPLLRKLGQRHQAEQRRPLKPGKRPKPQNLRVSYDQLAALRANHLALFHCGLSDLENLRLQVLLGKFQQKALNLERWIKC